jgi:diguanylate cyclase (GGDEF)-like protein/PAS domain S-box-containing protein
MPDRDFYRNLLDNLFDGVYFVDRQRTITYWNQAAERITGFSGQDVIGKSCAHNLLNHVDEEGNHLCHGACPLAIAMAEGRSRSAEVFLHHRDGHRVPVLVRVTSIKDEAGKVIGAVEVFSDNTPQITARQHIEELQHMAYIDELTDLANRRYTELSLRRRHQEMVRYGWPFGVVVMDIDGFKEVNDTAGHEVGDRVLRMVARSLAASARTFDILGRWGGDEFVAVVANVDLEGLEGIARRFQVLVEKSSLRFDGRALRVTLSIGATLASPGESQKQLLRRADSLMYESKQAGGNRVTIGSGSVGD